MSTIAARLLSKQSDFSQPKVIKVCTAGKVYRTAFPPDEILSLQFIGRSFTQRSSMTVLTSSLLKGDPNDFDADHYIFSVVDLSRGGLRRVLETDKELNDAADDAYRKGKVLRLEITGKITSRVLAESLLKSSFVSDIKNIVISGSATVGRAAMMSEGLLSGSYLEINKESREQPPSEALSESMAQAGSARVQSSEGPKSVPVSSVVDEGRIHEKRRSARVAKWLEDANVYPVEGKYDALVANGFSCNDDQQIQRDITRTFPQHDTYKGEGGMGQSRLRRVLNAYAIHDPQVGYVQGMNFIAAYFLLYASEEDTFWLLDAIMRKPKFGLANVYSNGMSKLHVAMYQTDMALKQVAPRLHQHLESMDITPIMWLPSWTLPLFASKMPEPALGDSFDRFMEGGWNNMIRTAVGVLVMNEERLTACTYEQCLQQLTEVLWLQRNFTAMLEDALDANGNRMSDSDMARWERQYLGFEDDKEEKLSGIGSLLDNPATDLIAGGLILGIGFAIGLGVHLGRKLNKS
jgi:hypothetical protein